MGKRKCREKITAILSGYDDQSRSQKLRHSTCRDPEKKRKNNKNKADKQAAKEREADRNALEMAFTALESEGGDVPLQALAEYIGKDSKTIGAYLGDGKKAKADWKKSFEKFTKEDGKTYIRRVNK